MAGGEESPGLFLIIPHSASPLQQLPQALVKVKVAQSCLTLCDPMDCGLPGSSVHGISQARILEWVAIIFFQGIFPTQESNPRLLHWQVDSLPLSH